MTEKLDDFFLSKTSLVTKENKARVSECGSSSIKPLGKLFPKGKNTSKKNYIYTYLVYFSVVCSQRDIRGMIYLHPRVSYVGMDLAGQYPLTTRRDR